MTSTVVTNDLMLALGYLRSKQVRLVATVNPSARAHALSYYHKVDPKDKESLAVWGLSSLSTHVVIDSVDDVLTLWFVAGEVHTITFGKNATRDTYRAAFKRFPHPTKLEIVKLDHESAPHIARMSSVEVLECQPRSKLSPETLKLLAPLTNLQRIQLGKETPPFDIMVQLVDQFQHYDALRVSTLRNPVISSKAGCHAFVRLAHRTFQYRCRLATMTITELCHVLWMTLESKTNIFCSTSAACAVANLLLLLLGQVLARVVAPSSAPILIISTGVHHKDADRPITMELSSEERDLIAVGNVCARFVQVTDAKSVKPIFETVQFQAMLMTWLRLATSTKVFDALMLLWRALFPKYDGLARLFETPAMHATFMNLLTDVGEDSQHVVNASRMLCCILFASEHLRSLFETPAVRKSLILAANRSSHDLCKVHALCAVMRHLTEDLTLPPVPSLNPSARAQALLNDHMVDSMDEASLAVWGLPLLSTHVVINNVEDVRTLGPLVGQVHTITFGTDATWETYKAAFKRFPRATKLVNVKLDHKSAPHVASMSSVEVLECQPSSDLTPVTLKLLAPLNRVQRIKLGDEEPSFDVILQLVDQFERYDALCVSTLRNPVIESEAGCDAFVRLAYRTFVRTDLAPVGRRIVRIVSGGWAFHTTAASEADCDASVRTTHRTLMSGRTGSTAHMTIAQMCRVVCLTLASKAKVLSNTTVADLLTQLLQQALTRISVSPKVRIGAGYHEAQEKSAKELSSEETDLIAVGNVCTRFVKHTDAVLVQRTFETAKVQSMILTWLTVARSSEVFKPLLILFRTLLDKCAGLAKFFETPTAHSTIMNVFLRVGVPSQLVIYTSRMVICILSECKVFRSLLEAPITRKSLTLATIQNCHNLRTLHALRVVMRDLAGLCNFRPNQYTSVFDAFVAVMLTIKPPMVEELCRETAKMIGIVTHRAQEKVSVHHTSWKAAEANLASMSVDDWLARLMATSSVALQAILRQKFLLKS